MNIPNALSVLRLLLVPVFIFVFFADFEGAYYAAGAVFLFAALTDVLDGYIARKYQRITKLGRLLDPLADKLMKGAASVCLAVAGVIPVWAVLLIYFKELSMLAGTLLFYKRMRDVPASNLLGKAAEFSLCALTLAEIVFPVPVQISNALWLAVLAAEYGAGIAYAFRASKSINQAKEEVHED